MNKPRSDGRKALSLAAKETSAANEAITLGSWVSCYDAAVCGLGHLDALLVGGAAIEKRAVQPLEGAVAGIRDVPVNKLGEP